ncbi:Metallo-dependent phosphatase-like protein [Ochromonadaceae sp. CCMP2298]|nr:Metallo-dependent phosphatase-like protein [Ochromonadaceae sp. CCMP2298]
MPVTIAATLTEPPLSPPEPEPQEQQDHGLEHEQEQERDQIQHQEQEQEQYEDEDEEQDQEQGDAVDSEERERNTWDVDEGEQDGEEAPLQLLHKVCKSHSARVIVIGDVHGCLDELCDLLRKTCYLPGDQVLFLGDLVAKGPRSVEVVRLAIDIDAISVRGNHDHEVVRQRITYERHHHAASLASAANAAIANAANAASSFAWLTELPYFVRSMDLGSVFVHAGLQSTDRVKLQHQEPWVMMTMRSMIPPTGKASSRCVLAFPWAAHWRGPLTAYFGHDTARGLQVYPHALGIDTGCVYGGNLTAVLLPSKGVVRVPARRVYQQYGKSIVQTLSSGAGPYSSIDAIPSVF